MPITIGSNITSLGAQRAFANATKDVGTSFERLASGMRINKASDDAAGLAISEQLNSDSKVFTQAIRNVNDGISAIAIAESALSELSDIVIRVRELATQSANGAISNTQRASIDEEAQALSDEFTRIIESTEFNETKLLDGSTREIRIQAGYGLDGSVVSGDRLITTGDGTFTADSTYAAGSEPRSIAIGDLNGDGIDDLALSNRGSDDVTIHIGNGNGTFQTPVSYAAGDYNQSVDIGDLNNDGILDLATCNTAGDDVTVLIGNGNGTFKSPVTYGAGDGATRFKFGDFNGDNNLDIATANFDSYDISILIGNGDGTFEDAVTINAGSRANTLEVADLNGDGFTDIVTGKPGSGVDVCLGNGDGTFNNAVNYHNGIRVEAISLGDVNNDGIFDIATGDWSGDSASILLGNGNGTFQNALTTSTGVKPYAIDLADTNGDGLLDMVTGVGGTLNLHIGNGNGTFQDATAYSVGGAVRDVVLHDLDKDGALDLISGSGSSNTLSILLGNTKTTEESVFSVDSLDSFSLKTMHGALSALEPLETQLNTIVSQRGGLGAFHSRLQVASNVLQVSTENYKAAESRIKDADIAQESANLVRNQILQQASAAVLAQANQQPSLALTLLS